MLSWYCLNLRPVGGAESAPSWFFQNNSKTVADIDTNLVCLMLHRFDIEWLNLVEVGRKMFEKLTFMWDHFTPILFKIGAMLRNSPKIEFQSKPHKKTSTDVKWNVLQNGYLEIQDFLFWNPQNFKKYIFWENLYKIQTFLKFDKTGTYSYLIELHVYYLHAKF